MGKIFNKGLTEEEKKEGLLKRLKNIEGKIKNEDKKQSGPIKNDKQSEPLKNKSDLVDKKPKEIVLPKDRLDSIFENFVSNFNNTGKKFLKKLAKDEKIDYNNLLFNNDDKSLVKSNVFLQEVGTLYDLLIYLLGNSK